MVESGMPARYLLVQLTRKYYFSKKTSPLKHFLLKLRVNRRKTFVD